MNLSTISLIAAAVCFGLKAINVNTSIDLMNLGFMFVVISVIL